MRSFHTVTCTSKLITVLIFLLRIIQCFRASKHVKFLHRAFAARAIILREYG